MVQTAFSDLETRSGGFLSGISSVDSGMDGAVFLTASYDGGAYSDALFDRLGVHCPDAIKRAAQKRKADYLAGRSIAKAAMRALGVPPNPVTSAASRAPIWPDGITGSISHARGRCACLLSSDTSQSVGVDTEAIASGSSLAAILSETLTPQDRDTISADVSSQPTNATLVFSAKEALFKALYTRVNCYFGFDAAELAAPPGQDMLHLRLTKDLATGVNKGDTFPVYFNVTATHVLTWLSVPSA